MQGHGLDHPHLGAISLCATTAEPAPQGLYPVTQATQKRSLHSATKSSPCLIQLEKALTATKTQHNQKVKINLKKRMSLGVTSYLYLMGMNVSGQSLQESCEKVLKNI